MHFKFFVMKNYTLYIAVRIEVQSRLKSLSETVTDFETQTDYSFASTQNVKVLETEILFTQPFNPLNHGTQHKL